MSETSYDFDAIVVGAGPSGTSAAMTMAKGGLNVLLLERGMRPFPALDRRFIISTNGGDEPRWSHDGRELFYLGDTRMMAVAIETEPDFEPGLPEMLFEHDWMQPRSSFDVAADGRFVMIRDETPPVTSIEVVLNWSQELEAVR